MEGLQILSKLSLYGLLTVMGLFILLVWGWQILILRGRSLKNPDGSTDDWRQQKTHYGLAFADVFFACPLGMAGIALVFICPRLGHYLLSLISFWFVWANIATTATSLRFEKPKITLGWVITFPFGSVVGFAYLLWIGIHFRAVFVP